MAYSLIGWTDKLSDGSRSGDRMWEHKLEVSRNEKLAHSFVATVKVVTHTRNKERNGWSQVGDEELVYHGEHTSLIAGARAAKKAYKRSILLRDGPP